jgi:hypothetical protein
MTWEEAKAKIEQHIVPGLKLEDGQQYRFVGRVDTEPQWTAWVRVAAVADAPVTMDMLEDIFHAVQKEGGVYHRLVIPRKHRGKVETNGSYVHVIGAIFHKAGIAGPREGRKYRFL